MATLCTLTVKGKTNGTVVVATRILRGKVERLVEFKTLSQIEGALTAEKSGIIEILGNVPEHVIEKLSEKGKNRFSNQTFGKDAESNPDAHVAMPVPSNKKEDVEDLVDTGADSSIADMPVISNKEEDVEDTSGEGADSSIAEFSTPDVTPSEDEVPEGTKGLSREDIIDMTANELKKYISDNGLDIKGTSKMNARKLTEEVINHFGYEPLAEDEDK